MKIDKIIKSIVLSSMLSSSLLADAATDAYIAYLMSQMYPNSNTAPTLTLTSTTNQSRNIDNNETSASVSFDMTDDASTPTFTYLATGDTTYFDIVKNASDIAVSLKTNQTIANGTSKRITFNIVANDGELSSRAVLSTLTFTNPDNVTAPVINTFTAPTFSTDVLDKVQTITFDTDISDTNNSALPLSSLFVDSNDTDFMSVVLLDATTVKFTRHEAKSATVQVTLYATNNDGLASSQSITFTPPELNMPPYLSIPNKNITVYSSTSLWSVDVPYGVYDYNDDFNTINFPAHTLTDANLTSDASKITITGTHSLSPGESHNYYVTVNADDGVLSSVNQNITITVINDNTVPVLNLPFTSIDNLAQGDSSSKAVTLYDDTNTLAELNVTLELTDSSTTESNTTTANLVSVSDGKVKIDFDKASKTITATTLQYNEGVTYTVSLSAQDPDGESTATRTFTLTTQGANTALINSLVPVEIKDISTPTCANQYTYEDTNLSDESNFKIDYLSTSDEIQFNTFIYGSSDLSTLSLAYYPDEQMYGAPENDNNQTAIIKFEVAEPGQFSAGRIMCIVLDSNVSNQTCWALATPEQKAALDAYEAGYCTPFEL